MKSITTLGKWIAVMVLATVVLIEPSGSTVFAQIDEGYWDLVDVQIVQNDKVADKCREENGYMESGFSTFAVKDECNDPDEVDGWPILWETIISWAPPPSQIEPGQNINMKARIGLVDHYVKTEEPQDFIDIKLTGGDGENILTITDNVPLSVLTFEGSNPESHFIVPGIKDIPKTANDTIKLEVMTRSGRVVYTYQWVKGTAKEESDLEGDESEPGEMEELTPENNIMQTPEFLPTRSVEDKSCPAMDSGTRFGQISGNVDVAPCVDPEDWMAADIHMTLYVDDRIRTGRDSAALLNFTDMTTFIMKPETIIVLEMPYQSDSKIELVWGTLKVNVKKMLKDGSMEITMNQAVAGIKGTTFIAEETGSESRIKVLDGVVNFTDLRDGTSVEVNPGETVAVTESGMGELQEFDVAAEEKSWEIYQEEEKGLLNCCLRDKLIGLFGVIVLLQLRHKRQRSQEENKNQDTVTAVEENDVK